MYNELEQDKVQSFLDLGCRHVWTPMNDYKAENADDNTLSFSHSHVDGECKRCGLKTKVDYYWTRVDEQDKEFEDGRSEEECTPWDEELENLDFSLDKAMRLILEKLKEWQYEYTIWCSTVSNPDTWVKVSTNFGEATACARTENEAVFKAVLKLADLHAGGE